MGRRNLEVEPERAVPWLVYAGQGVVPSRAGRAEKVQREAIVFGVPVAPE